MAKVKIVPLYYRSYNYGGTLQVYALYKAIADLGEDCRVLDLDRLAKRLFSDQELYGSQSCPPVPLKSKINGKISRIIGKTIYKNLNNKFATRNERFEHFRNMRLDTETLEYSNLGQCDLDVDLAIAGSDQIWNPSFACDVHFLTFISSNTVKMAYAASIGKSKLSEDILCKYKKLLSEFDFVSVREESAKQIAINKMGITKTRLVADPVFLLKRSDWMELIDGIICKHKNYAFIYFIGGSRHNRSIAKKIAALQGLLTVSIPYINQKYIPMELSSKVLLFDAAPEDFILYINNSDMVITDSFHAAAFSIILHRNFVVLDREPGISEMLSRITTLLSYFNLSERLIVSLDDIKNLKEIDWDTVDRRVASMREDSLSFLIEGINFDKNT